MSERNDTGWWNVEPPEYEFEPPVYTDDPEYEKLEDCPMAVPYSFEDEMREEEEHRRRELALGELDEFLDASRPHALFENVRIDDHGNFRVPERYIQTPNHGIWSFSAYGRKGVFKDRDEYGQVRFLRAGGEINGAIWIPHLYPFEETDEKGLPLIRDRERAQLFVELTPVRDRARYIDETSTAEIIVNQQTYGAQESMEFWNGSDSKTFDEFIAVNKELFAETVEYPEEKWVSVSEYLYEKGTIEDYVDIMTGKKPLPEEYSLQHEPLDWQTRQVSPYEGNALGSIWVPIDGLWRGIEADIIFPQFNTGLLESREE